MKSFKRMKEILICTFKRVSYFSEQIQETNYNVI